MVCAVPDARTTAWIAVFVVGMATIGRAQEHGPVATTLVDGDEPRDLPSRYSLAADTAIGREELAAEPTFRTATVAESAGDFAPTVSPAALTTATVAAAPAKPPPLPPSPYKDLYFDNDFSYLDNPDNTFFYLGDALKQRHPWPGATLDLGGEYRLRHQNEHNFRNSGSNLAGSFLVGQSDDFLLLRTRLFADLKGAEWWRVYGEAIDAASNFERAPSRTIEENRWDALNLFGDLLLYGDENAKLWGRAGRQEQLYGAQRLISPLDWSNTRRTFDGAKILWRGADWNIDGFWLRPVSFAQHAGNDHNFDAPDQSQEFIGLYATNKKTKDRIYDFYYLRLTEYDAPGSAANPFDFDVNLFGARWYGKQGSWLWEIEGGYQFGNFGAKIDSAGFYVVGLGHELSDGPWKPTFWTYFDWASGTADPNGRIHGTFNQLFPLSHKYFGFMDLVARQNIQDANFLLTATPTKNTRALCWYHIFFLEEARDALYNAAGVPIRSDPTGAAGRNVGQELDFTWQYIFSPRCDLLLGYSHFFEGRFVRATNPAGVDGNADFFYNQFTLRF